MNLKKWLSFPGLGICDFSKDKTIFKSLVKDDEYIVQIKTKDYKKAKYVFDNCLKEG